jgi:SAM-dependent methyltransferase
LNNSDLAYDGHELEAAARLHNFYRWITDGFRPYLRGRAAEIGAGIGTYSEYLRPHVDTLDIVEPSANQQSVLRAKFADDPCIRVHSDTIEGFHARVGDGALDAICMVNVLEHIENDEKALLFLNRLIGDGGHLCVFVPAMPFLYSDFDKSIGHFRRYTKPELIAKFEAAGFDVVAVKYMDVLGILAWGLVNTLLGAKTLNPLMMRIYDTVCVPLTRAIEAVIPAPAGKNVLIVGRKHG